MARLRARSPAEDTLYHGQKRIPKGDAASLESQPMPSREPLTKKANADDKEVQQLRLKVAADQKRLRKLLNERKRQAEKEELRRHSKLASLIASGLQAPGHPMPNETPTFAGTTIATNAAYLPVAGAITASENLLEEYARLDDMIKGMREEQMQPLGETWNLDIEGADGKLRMGARVALRRVGKVLGVDKVEDDGDEIMEDEDGVAASVGEEMEVGEKGYGLHKTLRYAERGVRRMVKGFKEEE